ncbi:hypothetical protein FJU30_09645 [Affinibrenneria salicis]|uniref:Fe-only nitrogenase accessory protein AnfO n=1 Tax=Affinibrenneria salicis TaxID=2590031 RepID=A0A5J5G169_9GAMM|nr:Fe-only nitrogenase accessory AnfO family protein [Affinibrenneria salicis]KAA9000497.1 hypothetical protein FJU30_09645 [Affinibrenneria salicis]
MKIAVFTNASGDSAALYDAGCVRVYRRGQDGWQVVDSFDWSLRPDMPLREVQAAARRLFEQLTGCHHFAAAAIPGALRAWFDGMGITMWQLTGAPLPALDHISQLIARKNQRRHATPAEFISTADDGKRLQIDLAAALRANSALTSRQVLLPVLQSGQFTQVDVLCDHLPKWFARELAVLHLTVSTREEAPGQLRARVRHAAD